MIGAIGGALVVFGVLFFDRIRADDPVGATSVHLLNGVFGTLCVGLFATPDRIARSGNTEQKAGLFYGGGAEQFIDQLIGVVTCGLYVIVVSAVAWMVIKAVMGLRVTEEEERDAGHGKPEGLGDDGVRELVCEQRGEEQQPGCERHGPRERGAPALVPVGEDPGAESPDDQAEDDQDAEVEPDLDAEQVAERQAAAGGSRGGGRRIGGRAQVRV